MLFIVCNRNLLWEEIFLNHTISLSEEIVLIFDYFIHNKRYIKDIRIQKCVLALIFANINKISQN